MARFVFPVACFVLCLTQSGIAAEDYQGAAPERPRIGLVLGGGGAKGSAHVGVLSVLDELNIPVDCIAGTSMGALVGGIYATGMPAVELEQSTRDINWAATVGNEGRRDRQPIDRKIAGVGYTNSFEIGIRNGRLAIPAGLLGTQDIEGVIRDLVQNGRYQRDFDALSIPFRAVATDMVSGEMVVIGDGDLSVAMRASMALPGVFSPVIVADQVLADGGMVRNLPVDVARDLCADVVIAVWLESPPPDPVQLESAVGMLGRATDVMINANERAQIDSLTAQDVAIAVQMGDITGVDFQRTPEAIELGRAAALGQAEALKHYSLSEPAYQAWRASLPFNDDERVQVADVQINGLDRVSLEYVRSAMRHARSGVEITTAQIAEDVNRVYALGDFKQVDYQLRGPPEARVLEITAVEKPWGPNFLRFDFGLAVQSNGELQAIARGEHSLTWVNSRGGRWSSVLQFGRQAIIATDFYQPLDVAQRFYLQPSLRFVRNVEDVYSDGERVARYFLSELKGGLDLGINLGTRTRLLTGMNLGWIESELDTGSPILDNLNKERESNVLLGAVYDTRNAIGLTTGGTYFNARYVNSGSWAGGEQRYEVAEAIVTQSLPWRGDALNFFAATGGKLSGLLPPTRDFMLGGIRSFPGLQLNELRGTKYWVAGGRYLWKLADIQPLFGQALYGGLRAQAGRMGGRIDEVEEGALYGLSGSLSGRTPVGPFILSLGWVNNDSWQLQFALGRPVPENSIIDQLY